MKGIPLTRCAFVVPFADVLTDMGAPTAALLHKYHLPSSLKEDLGHFVPLLPAIDFAVAGQLSQGIPDFCYLAARLFRFGDLSEELRTSVIQSATLYAALKQLVRRAPIEETNYRLWFERDGDSLKVCSVIAGSKGLPHFEYSQWLQNLLIICIVRQFAGPDWAPLTIAFEARYMPSPETQALWPNTRFLSGEYASWIDIPIALLSLPGRASRRRPAPPPPAEAIPDGSNITTAIKQMLPAEAVPDGSDIITSIKQMLPAYVGGTLPTIADVAEMAVTSVRSLQRSLSLAGLNYSGLIHQVRYEVAVGVLGNREAKIIDAAFAAGYDDPAHFARAFRRIAGVTPREFRRDQQSRATVGPLD